MTPPTTSRLGARVRPPRDTTSAALYLLRTGERSVEIVRPSLAEVRAKVAVIHGETARRMAWRRAKAAAWAVLAAVAALTFVAAAAVSIIKGSRVDGAVLLVAASYLAVVAKAQVARYRGRA